MYHNKNHFNSFYQKFEHSAMVSRMINQSMAALDAINNTPINLAIKSHFIAETTARLHKNINMTHLSFVQMARYSSAQDAIKKGVSKFKKGFGNLKHLVDRDWYVSTKVLGNLELNSLSELARLTNNRNLEKIEDLFVQSFMPSFKPSVFLKL